MYTEATWADEIGELVSAILTFQKIFVSARTIWLRARARFINKEDAGRLFELSPPVAGQGSGDSVPAGVSLLTVFRTPRPKTILKKYHGTLGVPVITADGEIISTAITQAVTWMTDLLAGLTTTTQTWSYGFYDADIATFFEPTSGYVNVEPAYQRRRRRGHGQ